MNYIVDFNNQRIVNKVGDKIKCKKNYKYETISYNTYFKKGNVCTITKYKQRFDGIMYFIIENL
ncbi:hypothetical protein M0Q50_02490 [bacterium]|jgi:hypothetical protein|nr:hypothetical protein [bacterium]